MQVLIIKTSSMGDVIHLLPALVDATQKVGPIKFDWVVEEGFAEIPSWHPFVQHTIVVALRRWRKQWKTCKAWKEMYAFIKTLRRKKYDLIIDAQGLVKSAWISLLARGLRCGLNWHSAWEPLASICYQKKYQVNPAQHAITRMRNLLAEVFGYALPTGLPDYGVIRNQFQYSITVSNYVVLIHGTTWTTKLWPERYWIALARRLVQAGFNVVVPWGSQAEQERAERIVQAAQTGTVLPKLALNEIAGVIAHAKAVVAVDTGLGHLAAMLAVPCISLYGPTSAKEVGTIGEGQIHLSEPFECAPCRKENCTYTQRTEIVPACFIQVTPELVLNQLFSMLGVKGD